MFSNDGFILLTHTLNSRMEKCIIRGKTELKYVALTFSLEIFFLGKGGLSYFFVTACVCVHMCV